MNKIVYDLILKLEQCDDKHNRCDYLMEHSEITYLLEYIKELQQENKRLKELEYKFFDNSGDEESFTLEDYLEISNKLYDYEQENIQLKEDKRKAIEILKGSAMFYCEEDRQWLEELFKRILETLGDKENEI